MTAPLAGIDLGLNGPFGPPMQAAYRLLAQLGATVGVGDQRADAVIVETPLSGAPGLPPGTVQHATGVTLAASALVGWITGSTVEVSAGEVASHLYLPRVLEAGSASVDGAPRPPTPVGEGAVCIDVDADDEETFERLKATLDGDERMSPETMSARAQEWRLAVTPYRQPPFGTQPMVGVQLMPLGASPAPRPLGGGLREVGLGRLVVCDLTSMWAGPLATWLLAAAGADVVKVEPDCRVDGLRFGGGAEDLAPMFRALNRNKTRAPFDVRDPAARAALIDLVERADVIIDSFSPRVMPNLGLDPRSVIQRNPGALCLSMPAFSLGSPERPWVAYGTGVHATSGLGWTGSGYTEPAVSYPDPVAGLTAFFVVLAMLIGRENGWPPHSAEVTLRGAVEPLVALAAAGKRMPEVDQDEVDRLVSRLFASWGARTLPVAPFQARGIPVADRPAPALGGR